MVSTDASSVAIGAVLSQVQHSEELPVEFASRTLNDAERTYSLGEREAPAFIWGCEHWHYYLYGRHFTLRTDLSALTSLLSASTSGRRPMRVLRLAERLNQYNFTVVYRPGQDNMVHDILSHAPIPPSADLPSAAPREVHHHSSNSFFECSDSSFIGTIFGPTSISTISNSFFDGSDSSSIGNIFGPSYPPQSQSQN